jgi:hypothetical protein
MKRGGSISERVTCTKFWQKEEGGLTEVDFCAWHENQPNKNGTE